ncbi:MAG: hypothetical protein FJ128_02985 [Deltaproteobacteria bacterium]|nr:hypothetical protein [Deltaproteobacteria bacterium]
MFRKLMVMALVLGLVFTALPVRAAKPDATISIEFTTAAAGLGAAWGRGVVTYGDKTYQFQVRGIQVLAAGITRLSVNGEVYNLKNIDDLVGLYKKADPRGITFIEADRGMVVTNEKGVTLNLKAVQKGLELDLVKTGLTVRKVK